MTLIKVQDKEFVLRWDNKKARFCSSIEELFVLGKVLELDLDELEYAVLELERNNHNYAELGDYKGGFLFSKRL